MTNKVLTSEEIREMLEYRRAQELFPTCKDLEKKGRLWTIIANYNRTHPQKKEAEPQVIKTAFSNFDGRGIA